MQYKILLMSELSKNLASKNLTSKNLEPSPGPGALYVQIVNHEIQYVMLGLDGKTVIKSVISNGDLKEAGYDDVLIPDPLELKYDLCLRSDLPKNSKGRSLPKPGKLYVQLTDDGALRYTVLIVDKKRIIHREISKRSPDIGDFVIPKNLDLTDPDLKQGIIKIISSRAQTLELPSPQLEKPISAIALHRRDELDNLLQYHHVRDTVDSGNFQHGQYMKRLNVALFDAITKNLFWCISPLLNRGANKNSVESSGKETPLHVAARLGRVKCIIILFNKGANINVTECMGRTSLHFAVLSRSVKAVECVINHCKAELNPEDHFGQTPLGYAAKNGCLDVMNYLLSIEAIRTHESCGKALAEEDNKALRTAAEFGNFDAVKNLVPFYVADNALALYFAACDAHRFGHREIAEFLMTLEEVRQYALDGGSLQVLMQKHEKREKASLDLSGSQKTLIFTEPGCSDLSNLATQEKAQKEEVPLIAKMEQLSVKSRA